MKKIYLSIFSIAVFFTAASAQSEIEVLDAPNEIITSPSTQVEDVHLDVKNNTNSTLQVWVSREVISDLEGTANYFCWEQCYLPHVSQSPTSLEIPANSSIPNFYAYFEPNGIEGTATIEYCFYTQGDPGLESCFTMDWVSSSSSSLADVEDPNRLSNAMPNPARDQVAIEYESDLGNARIVIYNLVGSVVKQVNLQNQEGRINMDVSDLSAGVYVYSLEAGNRTITSKKLSIVR